MPTIGNNQLPYPNTSDAPDVPGDLQRLAAATDTAIGSGNQLLNTYAQLQAIPNTQLFTGMMATVLNDTTPARNGQYEYLNGAWVMVYGDVTGMFTFIGGSYWTLNYLKAIRNRNHIDITFQTTKYGSALTVNTAWWAEPFLTFDPSFTPATEVQMQAISNATSPQSILVQVVNTSLNLRKPSSSDVVNVGNWIEFNGGWNF
mgnify:CR=1 FL=1